MSTFPAFGHERFLPQSVAGLALEFVEHYPDPRLGTQARYGHAAVAKADAYLYDLGLTEIANDLRSEQVAGFFWDACGGVTQATRRGTFLDFGAREPQFLHLTPDSPEPFCLWASFAYRQVPSSHAPVVVVAGRRVSNLALRIDCGHINKVRYTYPESAGQDDHQWFMAFIVEWAGHVRSAMDRPGV